MKELLLQDALSAAPALLGYVLVHETPEGVRAGRIVETEAYTATDAASHSFRGQTPRNAPMFGPSGRAYIYLTYGMHYCFNVVTGPEGDGQAVLIRALEPLRGIELMRLSRKREDLVQLTNGPAKLVQALGITPANQGANLLHGSLCLEPGSPPAAVVHTTRIGISRDVHRLWRFYEKDNPFVSRR